MLQDILYHVLVFFVIEIPKHLTLKHSHWTVVGMIIFEIQIPLGCPHVSSHTKQVSQLHPCRYVGYNSYNCLSLLWPWKWLSFSQEFSLPIKSIMNIVAFQSSKGYWAELHSPFQTAFLFWKIVRFGVFVLITPTALGRAFRLNLYEW